MTVVDAVRKSKTTAKAPTSPHGVLFTRCVVVANRTKNYLKITAAVDYCICYSILVSTLFSLGNKRGFRYTHTHSESNFVTNTHTHVCDCTGRHPSYKISTVYGLIRIPYLKLYIHTFTHSCRINIPITREHSLQPIRVRVKHLFNLLGYDCYCLLRLQCLQLQSLFPFLALLTLLWT